VVELTMRQPIREDGLADVRRSIPNYISLTLSDTETRAVSEFVGRFILPNRLLDEEATQAARRAAAAAVPVTTRTIEQGETILRAGDIVQPRQLEALEKLDLLQDTWDWRNVIGTALLVTLTVFTMGLYVVYRNPDFWVDGRRALLLACVILAFVILAKFMVPGRTLMPYIFPGAAAAMLLTVLLEPRFALSTTVLLAIMVSFLAGRSVELLVYILLGGLVASLTLWRVDRLMAFAWAGLYVILAQAITLASFRLIRGEYDPQAFIELGVAAVASGVLATSLTTVGYYVLGNIFDLTTSLRLMELARPNQPLLRELQLKAPGTYHHSLIVSNMAEEAAHRVGADPLLCRVGAYYHDIGKLKNPQLFIENQANGQNPHDDLPPAVSAQYILNHSRDGLAMAHEAGLPRSLADLIAQHHGTTVVRYFYAHALEDAKHGGPPVDPDQFRYPGPRPRSREAGILMLSDCCEAAVRAKKPGSLEEANTIIARVVDERLREGQLDDCPLTLRDIDRIREAFASVLQGVYHPRIEYPTVPGQTPPSTANGSNGAGVKPPVPVGQEGAL
jgi:putative nucleotidyltransferase with HDIG domain